MRIRTRLEWMQLMLRTRRVRGQPQLTSIDSSQSFCVFSLSFVQTLHVVPFQHRTIDEKKKCKYLFCYIFIAHFLVWCRRLCTSKREKLFLNWMMSGATHIVQMNNAFIYNGGNEMFVDDASIFNRNFPSFECIEWDIIAYRRIFDKARPPSTMCTLLIFLFLRSNVGDELLSTVAHVSKCIVASLWVCIPLSAPAPSTPFLFIHMMWKPTPLFCSRHHQLFI